MGIGYEYDNGKVRVNAAFFKNAAWGNASNLDRYSFTVVRVGPEQNEDVNQGNVRVAYAIDHGDFGETEIGLSGEFGGVYNNTTRKTGFHWAACAHLKGGYGPFGLWLEGFRYEYSPKNPPGVSDNTVLMGAFATSYPVAAKGTVFVADVSYNLNLHFLFFKMLTFYNDFSLLIKDEPGFNNSILNTTGCMLTATPLVVFLDFVQGRNAIWVGGPENSFAQGDPDASYDWLLNINVGFYF